MGAAKFPPNSRPPAYHEQDSVLFSNPPNFPHWKPWCDGGKLENSNYWIKGENHRSKCLKVQESIVSSKLMRPRTYCLEMTVQEMIVKHWTMGFHVKRRKYNMLWTWVIFILWIVGLLLPLSPFPPAAWLAWWSYHNSVTVNANCDPDEICNNMRDELLSTPVSDYSVWIR